MKRFLIIALMLCTVSVFSQEVVSIDIDGEEYSIIIPENLRDSYIRVMTAYLEEASDFDKLDIAFTEYKISSEKVIISKDNLIASKNELIDLKNQRIKLLENKFNWFGIIPSVYYSISPEGSGVGAGVGILLWDSFFVQAQGGYPLEARFSLGWKF